MGFTREQVTEALTHAQGLFSTNCCHATDTCLTGNEMLAAAYLLGDTDSDMDEDLEPQGEAPLHNLQLDPQSVVTALFNNPNFVQVIQCQCGATVIDV